MKKTAMLIGLILASLQPTTQGAASIVLPGVSQDADVHSISSTYCRQLWASLSNRRSDSKESAPFREMFEATVKEFETLIERIHHGKPILAEGALLLNPAPELEVGLAAIGECFDAESHGLLSTALTSMRVLGRHKGALDYDGETKAHVNEIFVYTWHQMKKDPATYLPKLLLGLCDAAPTCIQGYSVRMLCAIHPPKVKCN